MKIKVRIPHWVHTDNEGVMILFAFLRKMWVNYNLKGKSIDMYGYDIRRILNTESKYLHEYLYDHIDSKFCTIGKLNREHFVFNMEHAKNNSKLVTIEDPRYIYRWAYLLGCSNWNLVEEDDLGLDDRPHYIPMHRIERDLFEYTDRNE